MRRISPNAFKTMDNGAFQLIITICVQACGVQFQNVRFKFQNVRFTFQNVRLAFQNVRFATPHVMFGQ